MKLKLLASESKNITLSSGEKLTIIGSLAALLAAGIPLMETIDSMLQDAGGNQKKILATLKLDVSQGKSIADSFANFPKAFDAVTINLIKASEESGTLDTALKDLKENIKGDIEFSGKIKAALVYPVLVIIVFFGILLVILTFVIPRIAIVFAKLPVKLPLPTKILIASSNIFLTYTLYIVVGLAVFIFGLILLFKTQRKYFVRLLTSLPVVSKLARVIDLTRFTRSMTLLLSSGIPITEALALSQNVTAKKEIAEVIAGCQNAVASGKKLSQGLATSPKIIPSIMLRLTEAGEKSGSLEKSMQELSVHFDGEVNTSLKNLATILEPLLLIVVGLLVGAVMLAIISPIYGLISQISPR